MVMTLSTMGSAAAAPHGSITTSLVPGPGMGTRLRMTDAGLQRDVTVPAETALLHAHTPAAVKAAIQADVEVQPAIADRWSDATAVGDLDGDGLRDLVLQKGFFESRFVGVSGKDGSRLWSYTMDSGTEDGWSFGGVRALHSSDGGLLIDTVTYGDEQETAVSWSLEMVRTFTALNADGSVRWRKEYTGTVTGTDVSLTITGLPMLTCVAAIGGPGDDVAVSTYDVVVTEETAAGTGKVEVIDGATGISRAVAVAGAVPAEDFPATGVVKDLNGDRLADVITVSSGAGEVRVVAHSGVDGRPIWQNTFDGIPVSWVNSAGNTDGDGAQDILLMGVDWERWDNLFQTSLLSGADGATRWQAYSEMAAAVGDIGGDGRDDIVMVTIVDSGRQWGLRYTAVSGTGKRLYGVSHTVTVGPSMMTMLSLGLDMVGDVDGDGTDDFAHAITASGFRPRFYDKDRGPVLSATGRKAFDGSAAGSGLEASVDRRGDDFASVRRAKNEANITTRNGATGATIWETSLRMQGFRWGFARGGDITGDRRSEVIVIAQATHGSMVTVLDGLSGRVLWRRNTGNPGVIVTPG
jgi:hypothetical protein